jgi:hypothetical protein
MKKGLFAATAIASLAWAGGAHAATLIYASVTGVGGTYANWDTTTGGDWTLFVADNDGAGSDPVNANDQGINIGTTLGTNGFTTYGEGFLPSPQGGPAPNSHDQYVLTLGFAGGGTITGNYDADANFFMGSSGPLVIGNETLTLTEFSWQRNLGDDVQRYVATPGGDPNDYDGNFILSSTLGAVPEPGTWAMLLLGFGGIGFGMRRRRAENGRQRVRVAYS